MIKTSLRERSKNSLINQTVRILADIHVFIKLLYTIRLSEFSAGYIFFI